ncbi:MAG: FkbM family methyltransferase [Chthoniobacterales bacterium]
MPLPIPYQLKRFLRICDGRFSWRTERVQIREHSLRFYETFWWANASQPIFDDEIVPYFDVLTEDENPFSPFLIVDAGAASGHFAVAAASLFSQAKIVAFEPSLRQRILLRRNAARNGVEAVQIEPFGLWNRSDTLPFRTNGAESSFASVSRFDGRLPFPEHVPVLALDQWVAKSQISRLDLIKADIEGAEIHMLEGAVNTLDRFHPRLLLQAYHMVDGTRTFERCAHLLENFGYTISEPHPGLLYGV